MANFNSNLKSTIIAAIRAALKKDFESFQQASQQTRQSGNDEESQPDGKYDTQSTEANYLADGQARQAEEIAQAASCFETMQARDFKSYHPIDLGALVEMEIHQQSQWFFLAPASGGLEIKVEDLEITLITPDSPLGKQIIGHYQGEQISTPTATILSVH